MSLKPTKTPPVISGDDRIFLGTRKADNIKIFITKPKFDCGWYWSFGYLGNRDEHYHLKAYQEKKVLTKDQHGLPYGFTIKRNMHMRDALLEDYVLEPHIAENLWEFCELALTIYKLKEATEVFCIGGANTCENPDSELLADQVIYDRLVCELIPSQCRKFWDLVSGKVKS